MLQEPQVVQDRLDQLDLPEIPVSRDKMVVWERLVLRGPLEPQDLMVNQGSLE